MRSIFFQKTKNSGVPVIPPSGRIGSEAKATQQKECVQYISLTDNAISLGILFA
jgi:hypothetical protein